MKKSVISLVGGIVFATLYYQVSLGQNTLIYGIFLIIIYAIVRPQAVLKKTSLAIAATVLATAIAVTYHGSGLSIFCYFTSCFLFVGSMAPKRCSLYVKWLNGLYSFVFGSFDHFIYQRETTNSDLPEIRYWFLVKLIGIPLILVLLFTYFYSSSNPIFSGWLDRLDYSFINVGWFFMVILGVFATWNLVNPGTIDQLTDMDDNASDHLEKIAINASEKPKLLDSIRIGKWCMISLNTLLALVLVTEVLFILQIHEVDQAHLLSEAVHKGVGSSIVSIVIAISILLFFFHGKINFVKENHILKTLSILWIALNTILVICVVVKNYQYTFLYGVTLKRLGVFLYLTLCLIGLFTTYIKINSLRTNTYLIRRNVLAGFVLLSIASLANWSAIITRFNIDQNHIDYGQLYRLYPQNVLELQEANLENQVLGSIYLPQKSLSDKKQQREWVEFNYTFYRAQKQLAHGEN